MIIIKNGNVTIPYMSEATAITNGVGFIPQTNSNLLPTPFANKSNYGVDAGSKFYPPTVKLITWNGRPSMKWTTNGVQNASSTSDWIIVYFGKNELINILQPNKTYTLVFDSSYQFQYVCSIIKSNGKDRVSDGAFVFKYYELQDESGQIYYQHKCTFKTVSNTASLLSKDTCIYLFIRQEDREKTNASYKIGNLKLFEGDSVSDLSSEYAFDNNAPSSIFIANTIYEI